MAKARRTATSQKSRFPYIHTYITIIQTVFQILFWIATAIGGIILMIGAIKQFSSELVPLLVKVQGAGVILFIAIVWFFMYIAIMASIDLLKVFLSIEEKCAVSAIALQRITTKR